MFLTGATFIYLVKCFLEKEFLPQERFAFNCYREVCQLTFEANRTADYKNKFIPKKYSNSNAGRELT